MDKKAQAALDQFAGQYRAGVIVLTRAKPAAKSMRRVNVYVDGVLTVMSEDALQRLLDIGFYRQVPS